MKVFISVDMEGIAGLTSWKEMEQDARRANKHITADVNAVIKGIKKAKATVDEILVCDSHGRGENIIPEELDPDALIIRGSPRIYYMVEGLDESFDLLFLIGYHSKIGIAGGVMDHSYSSSAIYEVKLNGESIGEFEINAGYAGHYNVPVGLVSGDDILEKQVKERLPRTRYVVTKYGISRYASKNVHPDTAREKLEEEAFQAVNHPKSFAPLNFELPMNVELALATTAQADVVAVLPQVRRESGRVITFKAPDFPYFYRMFSACIALAWYGNTLR